ncbi:MAG: hypothetical protein E7051_00125 [Lentisphaerae bacterium]|nr:hypothetical protein [Lentisphaerota bacterium]
MKGKIMDSVFEFIGTILELIGRFFTWLIKSVWHAVSALLVILIFFSFFHFSCNRKSNWDKFCSIDIDIAACGIDKTAILEQFKQDPLSYRQEVTRHKRKRFILITPQQANATGKQFIGKMESLDILRHDPKEEKRCNDILKQLCEVIPAKTNLPQKIYILDTPEVNAFCLPGGTIVICSGTLKQFNDDEIAWIIAHELAHGQAHHFAEQISKSMIQELATDTFIDKEKETFKLIGSHIAAFFINLKYSRTQEYEADRLAIYYVSKAGFNTQGAINVLNKFNTTEEAEWGKWLSTHPTPEKRLKNIKSAVSQLQENPEHIWGSLKDDLLEKAKVKAIKIYMERKNSPEKREFFASM